MEPDEIEQLLIRTARLTEENNKILRRMQRAERFARIGKILQVVLVLGLAVGAYLMIQPYLIEMKVFTEQYRGVMQRVNEPAQDIMRMIENFENEHGSILNRNQGSGTVEE